MRADEQTGQERRVKLLRNLKQMNHKVGAMYHILSKYQYGIWSRNLLRIIWPVRKNESQWARCKLPKDVEVLPELTPLRFLETGHHQAAEAVQQLGASLNRRGKESTNLAMQKVCCFMPEHTCTDGTLASKAHSKAGTAGWLTCWEVV